MSKPICLTDDDLIALIEDAECITTNKLASEIGISCGRARDLMRDRLVELALAQRIVLASYGWDFSYAWASVEAAEHMDFGSRRGDTPAEPWFMSRFDRYHILRSDA